MARKREWRGSVFRPTGRSVLWITVKVDGRWRNRPTPFLPGQEAQAEAFLADVREQLLAQEAAMAGAPGPVTVRGWGKRWLEQRADPYGSDEGHLRNHIYPAIGDRLLSEIEPRHIYAMVKGWKGAPRSLRNRYSTAHSLFRDAAVEGLIKANPCILSRPAHLPGIEDADAEWRSSAVFKRAELEALISPHPDIEPDSTMIYALLGLAALRHGEMAALRWRHYEPEREPLGCLLVANSYRRRRTKTGRTRWMPVHPLLAAALAAWKLKGWTKLMGRTPTEEDLVVPQPASPRRPEGMRSRYMTWERLERHLRDVLKLRHRRVHDLRRTFLSLAEADGADRRVLGWGTHGRAGDILSAYTEPDWRRLCGEVAKLQVQRSPAGGAKVRKLRG